MLKVIIGAVSGTVFLGWLTVVLATTTVAAGVWVATLTYQLGAATAQLAAAAVAQRQAVSQAVMRAKAKARLRRFVVAIPVAGVAAVAVYEEQDFREWREENPGGTRADYGCVVYDASVEVFDEFMADLEPVLENAPPWARPSRETLVGWLGECDSGEPTPE
ncbi:hypothetical protein [Histidinibacterium lentulum]|uniref:Uncharacterized protein n=1 Tax=Histidinibacterium lentulum TaxID=2480588 RepID=A0A3N2QW54_9RHOB|nr:hypothetical protein [Histidinibacterium lentulum]ROT99471.1 hypothetical protein EAT49_14760 [Histidinibacterium lentulum]